MFGGDGDGWAHCALGHKHWGLHGAAGLLLWHDGSVLLQHRALWSHHGGTWGILGGARNSGETAEQAAAREAGEEAGLQGSHYRPVGTFVDDHGGWSYTTVVGHARDAVRLTALTAETLEMRWVAVEDLHRLPLHPGFAATFDAVRAIS